MSNFEVFLKLRTEISKYRFCEVFNAVDHDTGEARLRWDFGYMNDEKRKKLIEWQADGSYDGAVFLLHYDGTDLQVERLTKERE